MISDDVFEAFATAVPAGTPELVPRDEIAAAIDAALCAGASQWPDLGVDPREFASAMARSWESTAALAELHAGDLYLAQACARGDARALAAFDRAFGATLASALRALRVADAAAADIAQDVRETLFVARKIAGERNEQVADAYEDKGRVLARLHRRGEATTAFSRAAEIYAQTQAPKQKLDEARALAAKQ